MTAAPPALSDPPTRWIIPSRIRTTPGARIVPVVTPSRRAARSTVAVCAAAGVASRSDNAGTSKSARRNRTRGLFEGMEECAA
jgi:hypothetical protein